MAKLVIKVGSQSYDHKLLGNKIYLPDGIAEGASDGDMISLDNVKGEFIEQDGIRCLHVTEVDGEPVETPPDHEDKMGDMMNEEDDTNDTSSDEMDEGEVQSVDDALSEKFNRSR